jgi:hypothetical protein
LHASAVRESNDRPLVRGDGPIEKEVGDIEARGFTLIELRYIYQQIVSEL